LDLRDQGGSKYIATAYGIVTNLGWLGGREQPVFWVNVLISIWNL